jgi:catechol 2,3-dioxygenase-like lactoylglutathione lyase family enzyme
MTVGPIEHVLVLSDDIDATRDFYRDVLGLRAGERPPLEFPGYWLYAGDTACVHVAERRPYAAHAAGLGLPVPDHGAGGRGPVDHVAFRAGDWDALVARLARCGVPSVTNTVPGGPRQVFFEDPNGVRVEVNVTPGSEDEAR